MEERSGPGFTVEPDWHGAVRVLLDRPARRNALDLETTQGLLDVLRNDAASLVVLGSSTPDVFSAGADLAVPDAERARLSDLLYECYEEMITRTGLVVAVVEGPAVGGGAQLSTAADIRVASPAARWRWPGPGHGLAVGAWILPTLLGRSRGLDLCLTSRWLDAAEAVDSGLVARTDTDPWESTATLLAALTRAAPAALSRVKHVATHPEILRALHEERHQNRQAWDGTAPAPREAAAEARAQARPARTEARVD
jgi:enoyl-CoA hydratase/carnithine racemase